jgi:glycerol-3-phosphate dehydrogenase
MTPPATDAGSSATERRSRDLARLGEEHFDVLVVGGGITGSGVALDAASRGLRTALIERDDLAAGTSSRTSKLVHGGLRYLEQFRFGLVREALQERATLLRLAPHLVRVEPFLAPVYGSLLQVPWIGAGMTLYGLLGAARDGGFPRYRRPSMARRLHPALRELRLKGGFVYHDAVDDDARLVVAVARTAMASGATVVTRVRASALRTHTGRACGVEANDVPSGETVSIRAGTVIDATGATGGPGGPFASEAGAVPVTPSLGIHLVLRRDRIRGEAGLTLRVPGRVVFLVPFDRHWILGTTDQPYEGPTERPRASALEVDELLSAANDNLDVGLTRDDVVATYAGIRPLAGDDSGSTVRASREHAIAEPVPGLITIRGGKLTTYRQIAAQVVDRVTSSRRSLTNRVGLVGSGMESQSDRSPLLSSLRGRHGSEAAAVLAYGRDRDLLEPLHPGADVLEAEVAWAVERELALSLDDVLARRLRLAILTPDHGSSVAERTARIVAPLLGWDADRCRAEVASYTTSSASEYGVPGAPERVGSPGSSVGRDGHRGHEIAA